MCGIAGYVGPDESAHVRLGAALKLISHRGPDSEGVRREEDISLGMTRLAIIDLRSGDQPMSSPDGRLCVVFNGEIYNYRELRDDLRRLGHSFRTESDTEVLLHMYEEHGADMCLLLRGMFAFAIHDREGGRLFLARDRFGKKPLYLRTVGDHFWFASELKAVVAASRDRCPLTISDQSIYDYLSLGTVPQPSTIYSDVTMVPPGSWADQRRGEAPRVTTYWAPRINPRSDLELAEASSEVRRILAEAVRLRLRSDVPLGVFLSGGIDSSIVATEAAAQAGSGLRTFTVSTDDPELDESSVAARTAARLGVRHEVLPLTINPEDAIHQVVQHYDQPFGDSSAIPSLQISRLAREHVTVVLNGDGGDELFGGYRRHVAAGQLDRVHGLRHLARPVTRLARGWEPPRRSRRGLALRLARGLTAEPRARYLIHTQDLLRESDRASTWRGSEEVEASERLLTAASPGTLLDSQMLDDIRINLPSDLLVKMDMACMASSVEGRSPMLDSELADFALSLPSHLRVRGGTGKWLLRRAYADVLPREVISGAKKGFEVPVQRWLDTVLRPLVADSVLTPSARVTRYVDSTRVEQLFGGEAFTDRNSAMLKYAVLVLELWLRSVEAGAAA